MTVNSLSHDQGRLRQLDFAKGICIILVVITHYHWSAEERTRFLFPFWIEMAVPVFMVITGYVAALSFHKKGMNLLAAYKPAYILGRLIRFIFPFIPVYIVECILVCISFKEPLAPDYLITVFLRGGLGPGSYFLPMMLQVVVIFPLIWAVVRKLGFKGLTICFSLNLLYEAIKTIINMDPALYRLLAFRYLFAVAFGCYLFIKQSEAKKENRIWYYVLGVIGALYIFIFNYTNAEPVITGQRATTSLFAVLFIVPLMMHLVRSGKINNRIIEALGKASFDICLVQMIFYWYISDLVDSFIPGKMLQLLFNIILCSALGFFYYKIENPVTQKIIMLMRKRKA